MQVSITLVHTLKAAKDEVARLLFSPDRKTLAACDDTFITLWDTATGSLRVTIDEIDDDMFFQLAFSPDNKWIAAASNEGHGRIWSTATGELKQMISVDDERMLSLAFSRDSKSIATGSEVLRVWDVETGELQHTLLGPGDYSLSFTARHERQEQEYPDELLEVSFSPSGKTLASSCPTANTVRLWSTETWKLKQTIVGCMASFSPNGAYLAVYGNVNGMRIYETVNWQLESTIHNKEVFHSPIFSSDSKMIATHSGRKIMLCNVKSGEVIRTLKDPIREVSALSFSLDGKVLLSGTWESIAFKGFGLRAWNIKTGECMSMLENEDEARDPYKGCRGDPPAFETMFGDRVGKVVIAMPSGSIRIWDLNW